MDSAAPLDKGVAIAGEPRVALNADTPTESVINKRTAYHMLISDDCVVSIHYTLTDQAGDILDSSEGKEPLHYLQGASNIIPGLENELTGKAIGASLKVTVAPGDGYGERQEQLVQAVPREAFEGVESIEAGMQFQAQTDNGPMSVVVTDVTDEEVTVDGNHPLAGQTLEFDVSIEKVRTATAEELEHGHPHEGSMAHHH